MTPTELVVELKKQPPSLVKFIEAPEVPKGSTTRHFYVTRQAAEKLARTRVFQWHNYPIRDSYIVKCQLEYDRIATTDLLSAAVEAGMQTDNQRLRSVFARQYFYATCFVNFYQFIYSSYSIVTWPKRNQWYAIKMGMD